MICESDLDEVILDFKTDSGDLLDSPVVKTLYFHCRGFRFDLAWRGGQEKKNPLKKKKD